MLHCNFELSRMEIPYEAQEIIPRLYIGSKKEAYSPRWIRDHDIVLIVNCTQHLEMPFAGTIRSLRVPLDDHPSHNSRFLLYHHDACKSISDVLRGPRGNVLVHCHMGVSRSSSVVAAYLMMEYRMSFVQCLNLIRSKKPETFRPFVVFEPALRRIERIHV